MGTSEYDVVVIGGGPNGLTAATVLASQGYQTLVIEGAVSIGGGCRTSELTLPGYHHDICSAVHPTGFFSTAFKELRLREFGLEWIHSDLSAAHPLDDGSAALLGPDLEETLSSLNRGDRQAYHRLTSPLLPDFEELSGQLLEPLSTKKSIGAHLRFGLKGIQPAMTLANRVFSDERAKALLAGCAAHSVLPLDFWGTSAFALIFLLSGNLFSWPVAKGGSRSITEALERVFLQCGGEIRCGLAIDRFDQLPSSRRYLFDTSPYQVLSICEERLPARYHRQLASFNYGPGVFKIDYALSCPIPWSDPNCLRASTVHVGGSLEEIAASERAAWEGRAPEKPFIIVCQQSLFDPSRAPDGRQTGYAYCHVPYGWSLSPLEAVERQIERLAPGFRDCILARHTRTASELQEYNPACRGGSITGGANTLGQLFMRPAKRLIPYSTPNPQIFLCSHSTPPGGGVHGMCGYNAAKFVARSLTR